VLIVPTLCEFCIVERIMTALQLCNRRANVAGAAHSYDVIAFLT